MFITLRVSQIESNPTNNLRFPRRVSCAAAMCVSEPAGFSAGCMNNKQSKVWEDNFDWKECNGDKFIVQKIDYMHNNPFTGKWQLSVNAIDYIHSIAKFYICGEQGIYSVINYRELEGIDLNNLPG